MLQINLRAVTGPMEIITIVRYEMPEK